MTWIPYPSSPPPPTYETVIIWTDDNYPFIGEFLADGLGYAFVIQGGPSLAITSITHWARIPSPNGDN